MQCPTISERNQQKTIFLLWMRILHNQIHQFSSNKRYHPANLSRMNTSKRAIEVILNDSNSYVEHARNDLIYGLAGHLFYNHISQSTATMLVGRLCKKADDEEMDSRLDVVSETYNKGKIGKPLRGISQLRYILTKYNNEDESRVNEILAKLNNALEIRSETAITGTTSIVSNTAVGDSSLVEKILWLMKWLGWQNRMETSSLKTQVVCHILLSISLIMSKSFPWIARNSPITLEVFSNAIETNELYQMIL